MFQPMFHLICQSCLVHDMTAVAQPAVWVGGAILASLLIRISWSLLHNGR